MSVIPAETEGPWKICVIRTVADELKSHPSVDTPRRASSAPGQHFDVVILGGGQSGLTAGGRLQVLGASYVIIERQANVGVAA
ncbi:uncharacterized protein Z518_10087 [Rhinocladiella mackenziei CBS 650.93]|uniref:Uncharacterized protein n=1 Tax=Rhinocladiella mackenziei CBS 650.93 TaxID=1442369 RepID=A0A0D2ICS0_9EURO|nr:uncharacterized protein Z518_10087 [Rhinocladiella mackenziei CBS 650.93]KIX01021.1 hypothetical protein Z518_10087 [Rhinocladiella mackenziei CBS 650.93]